jgi:hypothetical protein
MDFKQIKLVPEKVIEYDNDHTLNLLAQESVVKNDSSGVEATGVYNLDGSLTVTYNGVQGWYATYSKVTYRQELVKDVYYKLVLEAKAQSARDIQIRFVDTTSPTAIEVVGFEGRKTVSLGTEYAIYEYIIKAPKSMQFVIQLCFGNESYLANSSAANVIDVKQFKLIPEVTEEPVVFTIDNFDDYADQTALNAVYTHRVPTAGDNHDDAHIALEATAGVESSKGVKFMIGEHAVTGWDIFRTENGFTNTGLTDDLGYFAFWYKGDSSITSISVWLYWTGSQNSYTINVSNVPAEGGYVYVALSQYGKTATQITNFGIGYNHTDTSVTGTVYLDDFMFIDNIIGING